MKNTDPNVSVWEDHALWWQQNFTNGVDEEYEQQMLPLIQSHLEGCKSILDLGTGEGQIARAVASDDVFVCGLDRSLNQITQAVKLGEGPSYVRANSHQVPFVDDSFDAVIVCLVLEHVVEFEETIKEIVRVLRPNGRLVLFLNHPAFQTPNSGWIDDQILEEQYWRTGPYLVEQTTIENVDQDVAIPFTHRPLSTYINTLASNGLFITSFVEPAPFSVPEYPDASSIPRLLFISAVLLAR